MGLERFGPWRTQFFQREVTPRDILRRSNAPYRPEFMARIDEWMAGLSFVDAISMGDIYMVEQRQGCWAGTIEYAELGASSARLSPMTSAPLVRGLLALPLQYRRDHGLLRELHDMLWPELCELPYNDDLPVPAPRRTWYALRRGLSKQGTRVARRIRRALHRMRAG